MFNRVSVSHSWSSLLACMSLLAVAALLHAQAVSSLHGVISDAQGAVIPGALVALTSVTTGASRQVATDNTGEYQFLQEMPGEYTLSVTKPGFATATREHVVLQINVPATLNIQLEVGTTGQTVNVTAETSMVSTTDASIGNAFTEHSIRQLPLDTRNVVQLLSLQPGVTASGEVMGSRRDQNNITLDGVDVNDNENSGIGGVADIGSLQGSNANVPSSDSAIAGFNSVLPIPLDSVQEFRVTVAGQGADEGRSSGGQVVLVTKSGTNQLHGSAYEYNRNTDFAANSWFNNRDGVGITPLNRNQFGASLGGPIKKDRVFYFLNYERRIDASSQAVERMVPSQNLKQGILTFADTSGNIHTLTPAQLQQIDPLGIGVNPQYLSILQQYPAGNDPAYGADGGLNFTGYRFNAPDRLDNRAYVGKMDFILDSQAHHTLSVRGTLSNANQDQPNALAQFPGQGPASELLNNSKGMSATYTAILTPSLINNLTFGYTRQGLAYSGTTGNAFDLFPLDSLENYNARANGRILPVYNVVDNLTWTKGKHTITTGINFRFMTNNKSTYSQSYPQYGFNVNVAVGLGEDIDTRLANFAGVTLNDTYNDASALGILLGLVNNTQVTYQVGPNGTLLPQGAPDVRAFTMREYEGFVSDQWRVSPELTLTLGLRYTNDRPPYEANGLQVAPNVGLNEYFGQRDYLGSQGVPSNEMPNAILSYSPNGPVNGKPSWYNPNDNNFGPRFALAYSPKDRGGLLGKIFGSSGVFRAGGALLYDRFGSELITEFDQFGSFGLATTLNNPVSYTFTTSPRYNGTTPALPAAPTVGFPYTPPDVNGIVGEFEGIYPNLKSPYSMLLNASFARQLPGKLTLEVSYAGRLSRRLLLQGDVYTPLENLYDPASGQTWLGAMTTLRQTFNGICASTGVTTQNCSPSTIAGMVQANPGLVPNIPYITNMFPGVANAFFPGSTAANYFYGIYGVYNGSYLDMLHSSDRIVGNYIPGACATKFGCYTFFAPQGSSMPTWMNAGSANYDAGTVSLRRAFSSGLSLDFNYTLSHSIDNASAAEGSSGQDGAVIQNIFNPGQFRGSSDFDIRNQANIDVVYELPVGKGKAFWNNAPGWANEMFGGWQVSSIMRFSSGLPSVIQGNQTWDVNYWQNTLAIATAPFKVQNGYDSNGNPSLFSSINAASSFADDWPGSAAGARALVRLAGMTNFDLAVAKSFPLPWEGHRIQFRAEAYNAFNNVNFIQPSLALSNPGIFGEYQNTMPPREMQFALRYEF